MDGRKLQTFPGCHAVFSCAGVPVILRDLSFSAVFRSLFMDVCKTFKLRLSNATCHDSRRLCRRFITSKMFLDHFSSTSNTSACVDASASVAFHACWLYLAPVDQLPLTANMKREDVTGNVRNLSLESITHVVL